MIRFAGIILSFFFWNYACGQGRLESEYKLDVPLDEVAAVWSHLQESYEKNALSISKMKLKGSSATEIFIDKYFDAADGRFAEEEISLRYRKRFKDGELIKELIQLKTPHSEDKVVRNEIKFEVARQKQYTDARSRHAFLQHLKNADEERMAYHLAPYAIRPEQLITALKLKQTRKRIYLSDAANESYATLTLDKVSHANFPFQSYAELELELNEIRYTQSDAQGREKMENLNAEIKQALFSKFPSLKVDQRSKYRKLREQIAGSLLSKIYEQAEWFFFGTITIVALFLFTKDQLT